MFHNSLLNVQATVYGTHLRELFQSCERKSSCISVAVDNLKSPTNQISLVCISWGRYYITSDLWPSTMADGPQVGPRTTVPTIQRPRAKVPQNTHLGIELEASKPGSTSTLGPSGSGWGTLTGKERRSSAGDAYSDLHSGKTRAPIHTHIHQCYIQIQYLIALYLIDFGLMHRTLLRGLLLHTVGNFILEETDPAYLSP